MSAFMILFGFLLAIIANIKISILHRAVVEMYDILSVRIAEARKSHLDDASKEQTVLESDQVVPDAPEKKVDLDPYTLHTFYAMDRSARDSFFKSVSKIVKGEAFELLWRASYGDAGLQQAADLQGALKSMDAKTYALVKQAVQNAAKDLEERTSAKVAQASVEPTEAHIVPSAPKAVPSGPVIAEPEPIVVLQERHEEHQEDRQHDKRPEERKVKKKSSKKHPETPELSV